MDNLRANVLMVSGLLAALLVGLVYGQEDIVIRKEARTQNPTLYLETFSGPLEVRAQLVSDLTYSDWFSLVQDAETADYRLSASYSVLDSLREFNLHLKDRQGETVTHFRQRSADERVSWLVHYSVDALIEKVFGNPGFCASQLAFVRQNGLIKEIFSSEFDGSRPVQLTHNGGLSVEPAWRADGKYLMYTKYEPYSTSIVLIDLIRSEQRRLIHANGLNSGAAFSNDGRFAAVTLSRHGNVELYKKSLLDGSLVRLTRTRGVEASPTWSPDDRFICFVSDHFMISPTLGMISAQGGQPQRLLRGPFESVSPDWSPVSNQICFSLRQARRYTIAVLDMNEKNPEPKVVVDAAGDWESPAWAADGRHIVCTRNHQGTQTLYLVDSWFGTTRKLKADGQLSLPSYSNRF